MANADQIINLLHEAKARVPGLERDRFLAEACGNDVALKEQILSLLEAERSEDNSKFLRGSFFHERVVVTEKAGDKIGRYKLLQQIGEGGCGVVYMAEQEEPVRRRVAVKVIKLGMDTKQVIARFEAERQALAMMDHPNIARVLDAGTTENGRPYFVMELVRGTRITDYCDEHKLSTEHRLKLFMQVCQAVQHAHQKGIIHRDIKPSNILVTINDGVPVPKVIDFGIAKATQGRLTDQTLFTAFEQFIGTPAYMSPEQAVLTSLDVDTRSDIYSLGVLLYEILTGSPPFDQKQLLASGLDEMRRIIREEEPPRPSTRLSTLAAELSTTTAQQRHTQPPKLVHLVRGDLDWIVMKCLEKDRTRRYETATALVTDIHRHLASEPVMARPPSRLYEFQKTVRRHKFGFSAAAALVVVLTAGVVVSTYHAIRAKRAEQVAETARANESLLRQQLEYRLLISEAQKLFNAGNAGDAKKALDAIRPELFEPLSERVAVSRVLGLEYARQYHWTNAVSNLAVVVQNDYPTVPKWSRETADDQLYYTTATVMAGDLAAYDKYRRRLVTDLFRTNNSEGSWFLCRLVTLTPTDPAFMRSLEPFIKVACTATNYDVPADQIHYYKAFHIWALSLVAYRNEDYTNALTLIADSLAQRPAQGPTASFVHAVKAMTLYRMAQIQDAKQEFDLAKKPVDTTFKNGIAKINDTAQWFSWHIARIYINEAEKMMSDPATAKAMSLETAEQH